jgi:hypothetical protein
VDVSRETKMGVRTSEGKAISWCWHPTRPTVPT